MWKVKRMTIARNVVLTAADGAGDIVAYPPSWSDNKVLAAEPVAQLSAIDALVKDERAEANSTDFMMAVPPPGIRVPSLTKTLT
jgi:hypothetical protein